MSDVDSVNTLLALAAIGGLLLWMWANVLFDWLWCWKHRRITADMLTRLVIASAVSGVLVAVAVQA